MKRSAILILTLLTLHLGWQPTLHAQGDPAGEIIQHVNTVRAAHGLPPFQYNPSLAAAAQNQAGYMASNNIYSHTGSGGSTPQTRANAAGYSGYVSENIVGGTNLTPRKGVLWWENSPVHYRTMVSTRYTQIGAGFAAGYDQNFYAIVVGQPTDAPLPTNQTRPQDAPAEPLIVTPIELAVPQENGRIVHIVQQGQALWSLAAHYEVSLNNLLLFNNLGDNPLVNVGDEIVIRLSEGEAPPPTPTPPLTHRVRDGQTLWTLAALYEVKLTDLYLMNGMNEDSFLQPGQEVKVRLAPGEPLPPTPTPPTEHVVQQGDTAWNIAASYGLTLESFLAMNNLPAEPVLQLGQVVQVRQGVASIIEEVATLFPATFTPAPPQTVTPTPETAVSLALAASPDEVLSGEEPEPETAVLPTTDDISSATEQTPDLPRPQSSASRTILTGIILATLGLVALGGATIIALRRELF